MTIDHALRIVSDFGLLGIMAIVAWSFPRIVSEIRKDRKEIIATVVSMDERHVRELAQRSDACRAERQQFVDLLKGMAGLVRIRTKEAKETKLGTEDTA